MSNRETVIINGRVYDRLTGMPVVQQRANPEQPLATSSLSIHTQPERSTTLSRRYVKRPDYIVNHTKSSVASTQATTTKEYPSITRFTPTHASVKQSISSPVRKNVSVARPVAQPVKVAASADIPAGVHPFVQRVEAARAAKNEVRIPKPSDVIKNEAIAKALENAKSEPAASGRRRRQKDHSARDRRAKFSARLSFASGGLAVLLIGAYFTYISMPALSVRVAAAQAGVHASYPAYRPSGYSLSGAVAYQPGSVSMNFKQNGGKEGFTVTQANSGWDSSALLENYVLKQSGGQFDTSHDNGLTIYTFGNNAAWVSGGILYTIDSETTLSNDQIQKIATSL